MAQPVIGMFDPVFIQLLDDTQRPLRTVFRTENDLTMAISGTGTAGMEAAIYNVVEPGDTVVVCHNGYFGMRMAEMVERCGADVIPVEAAWGSIIEPEQVEAALKDAGRVKVVAIVHGETSTGVAPAARGDLAHHPRARTRCCSSTPSPRSAAASCGSTTGASTSATAARRSASRRRRGWRR